MTHARTRSRKIPIIPPEEGLSGAGAHKVSNHWCARVLIGIKNGKEREGHFIFLFWFPQGETKSLHSVKSDKSVGDG